MTWPAPGEDRWEDPHGDPGEGISVRWPLHWSGLYPRERWIWFEQLWDDVCMLRDRYRLAVRSGWWENEVQLEALMALSAWVFRYDSGEWDDPPGKLALLYDLERVSALLRDGVDPFNPDRDRAAFVHHLTQLGCEPPAVNDHRTPLVNGPDSPPSVNGHDPYSPRLNGHEPPPAANGHDPG